MENLRRKEHGTSVTIAEAGWLAVRSRLHTAGETNRAIADELALRGRTADRHMSNIFAKLSVSTRAAATVCAYKHRLI